MANVTKKQKEAAAKVDANKQYVLADATALVKRVSTTKFDG